MKTKINIIGMLLLTIVSLFADTSFVNNNQLQTGLNTRQPLKQVIFVGDSISDPTTNSLGNACWVRQFKFNYAPVAGATFTELAVAGTTAQTAATNIATTIASYSTTNGSGLVTVQFGTNDIGNGRSAAQIVADLQTIATGWQSKGFKVCIIGIPTGTNNNDIAESTNNLLAAATWWDYFVNLYVLTYEINDYVHPTVKGSLQIARIVASTLTGSNQAARITRLFLPQKATKAITSISLANPAVVTCNSHGYSTGQLVYISGTSGGTTTSGFTPLNGAVYSITVVNTNSFTIPVNCNGAATGGICNNAVVIFDSKLRASDFKSYILHMFSSSGGDQGSFIATAMNGYNEAIFGFSRITKTTFNMGSNDPMSGVNMLNNNLSTLYLVNNSSDFSYYLAGQEIFSSFR